MIHAFNSEAQSIALARTWPRCTYPWESLEWGVAWLVRPNGEVPLSWADLSSFAGAERLEAECYLRQGYQGVPKDVVTDWLMQPIGEQVEPSSRRRAHHARGYPVADDDRVVAAVAWDEGRIQLDQSLARGDDLPVALFTAGAYLVDLLVLSPEQRRAVHLSWDKKALSKTAYEKAGHPTYWQRCAPTLSAAFLAAFTDLGIEAPEETVALLRDVAVPDELPRFHMIAEPV
jgi:hypothetical protein